MCIISHTALSSVGSLLPRLSFSRGAVSTCCHCQWPPDPECSWSLPNATARYALSELNYILARRYVDPSLPDATLVPALGIPGPDVDLEEDCDKPLARPLRAIWGCGLRFTDPQAYLQNGGQFQVQRNTQQAFPLCNAQDSCHWPHWQLKLQC